MKGEKARNERKEGGEAAGEERGNKRRSGRPWLPLAQPWRLRKERREGESDAALTECSSDSQMQRLTATTLGHFTCFFLHATPTHTYSVHT